MVIEMVRLATQMIFRNALRSFLTVLGVVIGVASVILMVTLGQGATARVTADVQKLGSNLIMVMPGEGMDAGQIGAADLFSLADVQAIEEQVPGVDVAAPVHTRSMSTIFGGESLYTTVIGSDNRYLEAAAWELELGRAFTEGEVRSGTPVCIVGPTLREQLFDGGNPLGASIRLAQMSCRIVGTLETKGGSTLGQDQDNLVIMPLRAFQTRISGDRSVAFIYVSVSLDQSIDAVQRNIDELMRERRNIGWGADDDFSTLGMEQISSMLPTVTSILTGFWPLSRPSAWWLAASAS